MMNNRILWPAAAKQKMKKKAAKILQSWKKKIDDYFLKKKQTKKIRLLKILEKIILKLKRISCMYRVLFWDFVKKTVIFFSKISFLDRKSLPT